MKYLAPEVLASAVIGKGGQVISQIRTSTNAKIGLTDHGQVYPGTDSRVLTAQANAEESLNEVSKQIVQKLTEYVKASGPSEAVGSDGDFKVKAVVPRAAVGGVIGKGGSTIKQIRESSGARVSITEPIGSGPAAEQIVSISGTAEALEAVKHKDFADLSKELTTLEQKVAKWIHTHPMPAKVSEARLYSLEFRLAEETLSNAALARNYSTAAAQHPTGMKVIFLDVDGVLNIPELRAGNASMLLDQQVSLLAWLVKKVDAYIVLSSNWRYSPLHKLCLANALAKAGGAETRIVGQTPDFAEFERTRELQAWLAAIDPKPHSWVAIDDLDLFSDNPEYMEGHCVLVDPSFGLDSESAAEAARLLHCELEEQPGVRWQRLCCALYLCFGTRARDNRYRKSMALVVPIDSG